MRKKLKCIAGIMVLFFIFSFITGVSLIKAQRRDKKNREPLTLEQKKFVKSFLSKYDPDKLTKEDAETIKRAFKDKGLGGPSLKAAVREAGFSWDKIRELAPRGEKGRRGGRGRRRGGPRRHTIEQATSDRPQLHTLSFSGLAFVTGDYCCDSFLPPGKVTDFFGFQYMRDNDKSEMGHNTSFLTRIAFNILHMLNIAQRKKLIKLGKEQEDLINKLAYKRFPLIKAFRRVMDKDLPKGSKGLDKDAVIKYSGEIYAMDGKLTYKRAEIMAEVLNSFDKDQKELLSKLKFNDSSTWPERDRPINKRGMSHTAHVAVMTYASEMFSWLKGNVEADTYFCPEGMAKYFGAFYLKGRPARRKKNYSLNTALTGDSGAAFLELLNDKQRKTITGLVDKQRKALNGIVKTRREIAAHLRKFLNKKPVSRETILSLAKKYGEFDGEISYYYAIAFAEVYNTLHKEQKAKLMKLRNLDEYPCDGAYLYSKNIDMPVIINTDFLFAK